MPTATIPVTACRPHDTLAEILDRLSAAVREDAPKHALQRLLCDLVVHTTLHVKSHNPCAMADAEFLHHLQTLESGVARAQVALSDAHVERIREWLSGHAAPEFVTPLPLEPHHMS
ncbi:MAG: hypothetical protein HY821_11505 [Acidobacteria bacterium]|nr:hypothetical protein [Acidobacteriota bacterium]